MPAPSILNTWRFATSLPFSGATPVLMRQALLLGIKDRLRGVGAFTDEGNTASTVNTPWVVTRSSNSVTVSDSDLWAADADLVWAAAGVAHSWIILRHPDYFGTGVPLSMLLDCSPAGTFNATLGVVFSRVGFTGGTITARATATDEHVARPTGGTIATAGWQGDDNATVSTTMRMHFLMTADGRKFHVVLTRASVCIAYWGLFDCESDAGWTSPYLFNLASEDFAAGGELELLVQAHYANDTESLWLGRDQGGVGDFTAEPGLPIFANSNANPYTGLPLNGFNGGWLPMPICLRGLAPASGPLAVIPDCWLARVAESSGSPGQDVVTGQNSYMQFGAIMLPWNNSTIVMG